MKKKIDETISYVCEWIIKELNERFVHEDDIRPKMVSALAELIKARTELLQTRSNSLEPRNLKVTIDGEEIISILGNHD